MEANVLKLTSELGWCIERDNLQQTRAKHKELAQAVQQLVDNVQEFKLNTITQLHRQDNAPTANDWFVTPFDAYLRC